MCRDEIVGWNLLGTYNVCIRGKFLPSNLAFSCRFHFFPCFWGSSQSCLHVNIPLSYSHIQMKAKYLVSVVQHHHTKPFLNMFRKKLQDPLSFQDFTPFAGANTNGIQLFTGFRGQFLCKPTYSNRSYYLKSPLKITAYLASPYL